jgi:hypothetical protein
MDVAPFGIAGGEELDRELQRGLGSGVDEGAIAGEEHGLEMTVISEDTNGSATDLDLDGM